MYIVSGRKIEKKYKRKQIQSSIEFKSVHYKLSFISHNLLFTFKMYSQFHLLLISAAIMKVEMHQNCETFKRENARENLRFPQISQ